MAAYAELQAVSNFSFLDGASHPDELVREAARLGQAALAIADRNTLAGVVRAHAAARETGLRLLIGARLELGLESQPQSSLSLIALPTDRAAYGRLSTLITLGRRRAPKGQCWLTLADVLTSAQGQLFLVAPPDRPEAEFAQTLRELAGHWPGRCFLLANWLYRGDDRRRLADLAGLAASCGAPLLAGNDVHYHAPERRPLQDVLTCIRQHCTVHEAGWRLAANAERHLKAPAEMARLFAEHPAAIARTLEIASCCRFSLDELRYDYPVDPVPDGLSPQQHLEALAWAGATERYGGAVPEKVAGLLRHELALIGELGYAPYFLTVHDIVAFAKGRGILCQGRGSAANSAVCYCLGITAVDPTRIDLLFERFVSAERREPPDIDVDFEHERREEVIQYIYAKYGRERAGIAATTICYRPKSAIREVGKAFGLSLDQVAALSGNIWGWDEADLTSERLTELGLDPNDAGLRQAMQLTRTLIGFPRHLSQHVGGFVITRSPLSQVVPIENAAMAERTFVEWDKDDLDALGILKIDVLALGMLTCIAKAFGLIERHWRARYELATVPAEDPAVYDMLCRGDSLGVFQVESRAQMSMLPRLKPRNFYDLVIEVAIVRPGPIQGNMVHPYLRRRSGEEAVSYPSKELEAVLGKTLGVPLFQEQAMRIAIVAAGFTASEADKLRRAMATFRKTGTIHTFRQKMVDGMLARGYQREFAERCFQQIEGFGEYGFPESHAASFALLVYVSAWLKHYYPAAFAAALLNSQPMGFYAPAQIVRDATEHGVEVRAADVNRSDWDCTLEATDRGPALRLGLRLVKGLPQAAAERLVAARGTGYADMHQVRRRAGLGQPALQRLAEADCWRSLGLDRRQALWQVKGLGAHPLPLFALAESRPPSPDAAEEPTAALPAMPLGEHVVEDYVWTRLSLKRHPVAFFRPAFTAGGLVSAARFNAATRGARLAVAGLVLVRQRPGTAKGVIFVTLEDETGIANLIVRPPVFERHRRIVLGARLMAAWGRVEREGLVVHLLVERLVDWSDRLRLLKSESDMPAPIAHADEVRRPGRDPRAAMPKGRSFR
ncbi:MAG: error-prone DNA polymerase [Alphaproteobacteria bacterium]|nr:error-prone DNA polymerase [Alphaproteobacteria bacterium]